MTAGQPQVLAFADLSDANLADLYAYPEKRWVRANMVASVDGAAAIDGTVGNLTNSSDQRILNTVRSLADVVLIGAGTARAQRYVSVPATREIRQRHGLSPTVPVAVVSHRASLDPALVSAADVAPLVVTSRAAPAEATDALREAGAEVIVLDSPTATSILDALTERGYPRILCEGGPSVLGLLLAKNALDELCVTTAPMLVGGTAPRIVAASEHATSPMTCQHIVFDAAGYQFARWVRRAVRSGHG